MSRILRTGNIVTPPSPKVTERKSSAVRIGNGDAPDEALVRGLRMATGTAVVGYERKVPVQNMATTIARTSKDVPADPVRVVLPQSPEDRARGIFRESNGKKATRIVRTVDMGDAPLSDYTAPLVEVPQTLAVEPIAAPVADAPRLDREARREAKAERDAEIVAYLRRKGYKGSLTADIRVLALDALEQERQVAEYAAG